MTDTDKPVLVEQAAPHIHVAGIDRVCAEERTDTRAELRVAHRAPRSASALPRMILCWSSSDNDVRSLAKSDGSASPSACG